MKQTVQYKTKQREVILKYLKENKNKHITVEEIYNHLKRQRKEIGKTTIYRYLDILEKNGDVRKYIFGDKKANCFQYIVKKEDCNIHYHAKCEECRNVYHIDCDLLKEVEEHLKTEHDYILNNSKTVLCITCDNCRLNKGYK